MVLLFLIQSLKNSNHVFVTQIKLRKLMAVLSKAKNPTVSQFEKLYYSLCFVIDFILGPDRFSVDAGNSAYDGDYIKAGLYNNEQLYQKESNNEIRKRRQLPNQPFLFARGNYWFLDKNLAAEKELVSIALSAL